MKQMLVAALILEDAFLLFFFRTAVNAVCKGVVQNFCLHNNYRAFSSTTGLAPFWLIG